MQPQAQMAANAAPPGARPAWTPALIAGTVSGAALGAAFPSLGWSGLAWMALIPLLIIVAEAGSLWRALWPGYAAGAAFFAVSCPWIATTVHNYGDLSGALAGLVFVLFLLLMGSYLALFAAAGYWLGRGTGHRWALLPFLWVAVEWLRTYTPMGGFPWNLLGYSQTNNLGFMRATTVTGIYGASLLLALVNTWLAFMVVCAWRRPRRAGLSLPLAGQFWVAAGGVAVIGVVAALPFHPAPARVTLHASLVQPNTPLNATWSAADLDRFLAAQLNLSAPAGAPPADLVIWPEQPAPLNYRLEPDFQRTTVALEQRTGGAFLFGEVTYPVAANGTPNYNQPRNSAQLIHPNGTTGPRYDKMHLVPFGEYVPLPAWFAHFAGISKMLQDVSDFVPGQQPVLFTLGDQRFATMICYESIFPALARQDVAAGAAWLVNQSDDSWYGASSAAPQGLMMARVRAIENRRWLLRDTDNGITAVIDPYGRVTASLPRFQAAALEAGFAPETRLTFYTRHGDWLPLLCAVMIVLAGIFTACGARVTPPPQERGAGA